MHLPKFISQTNKSRISTASYAVLPLAAHNYSFDTVKGKVIGLTAASIVTLASTTSAVAAGIESLDSPIVLGDTPDFVKEIQRKNQSRLDEAEDTFQNSELLKNLLERSAANSEGNKKALRDRYCARQAELGVGDCAGLRLIPGMTKSGVQERPEWLDKLGKSFGLE